MAGTYGLRQWFDGWKREARPREIDPAEVGAEFGLELSFIAVTAPGRLSTGLPDIRPDRGRDVAGPLPA